MDWTGEELTGANGVEWGFQRSSQGPPRASWGPRGSFFGPLAESRRVLALFPTSLISVLATSGRIYLGRIGASSAHSGESVLFSPRG